MKILFFIVFGFVFCLAYSCEAKQCTKSFQRSQKIYVDPQEVRVTKDGIFLLKDGSLCPVNGVLIDARGVFVLEKRFYVKCQACKKEYDVDRHRHCPFCGHQ